MPVLQIIYCAGFFDGEGCVYIREWQDTRKGRTKNQYGITIRIGNTNPEPLKLFCKLFGGQLSKVKKKPEKDYWKQLWEWKCSQRKAQYFLESILPYLIIKKEEVEVALKFVQEVRRGYNNKLTKEETDKRKGYKKQMQLLKQREWAI